MQDAQNRRNNNELTFAFGMPKTEYPCWQSRSFVCNFNYWSTPIIIDIFAVHLEYKYLLTCWLLKIILPLCHGQRVWYWAGNWFEVLCQIVIVVAGRRFLLSSSFCAIWNNPSNCNSKSRREQDSSRRDTPEALLPKGAETSCGRKGIIIIN